MKDHSMAIIGLGGMGNWHRQLINDGVWFTGKLGEIKRLKVTGSFDVLEERQKFARDNGLNAYKSLKELLDDPNIEIVLVSTPNDFHMPLVIKALEAGKHVVSEKPVALNSKQLQKMIDASIKADRVFTVHQNRRWDVDYLKAKKIYNDKTLGDVFRVESRVHGYKGLFGVWRREPEHGGGMLLDWGVHILDQALQFTDGKIKKVYASLTHATNELVDDGFTAELTFDNGLIYLAEAGNSNFINLPRWYILGRDGTAVIDDFEGKGRIVRSKGYGKKDMDFIKTSPGITKTMAPRADKFIKEEALPEIKSDRREFYRNFAAAIEGKEKPHVSLDSVMRSMKLMETIFRSAKSGKPEKFE